jgi:F0F1-type ATP synthase membrane subunit b/b'
MRKTDMRFWTAYAFITLGLASKAWGAGDGSHGSLGDLIAPAVNVFVLFALLIWATKNKLKNYFDKRADEVANTVERANIKSKEAQMMLETQQRKMANLETEMKTIHQQADTDVMVYEKNLSKETEDKITKLKTDANSKVQADKKLIMDELNAELLEQVIAQTKTTIKNNKDYQSKVSTKMLQGL